MIAPPHPRTMKPQIRAAATSGPLTAMFSKTITTTTRSLGPVIYRIFIKSIHTIYLIFWAANVTLPLGDVSIGLGDGGSQMITKPVAYQT